MVTPSGKHLARTGSEQVIVEMKGEYALATLREISLMEEGVHLFRSGCAGSPRFCADSWHTMGRAAFAGVQ